MSAKGRKQLVWTFTIEDVYFNSGNYLALFANHICAAPFTPNFVIDSLRSC